MKRIPSLVFLGAFVGATMASACGGRVKRLDDPVGEHGDSAGAGATTTPIGGSGYATGGRESTSEGGSSAETSPSGQAGAGTLVRCPGGSVVAVSGPGPACGDGELDPPEQCDDGNTLSGDGCDSRCRIDDRWVCSQVGSACSRCGSCLLEGDEQCDDGNTENGDGCSELCRTEAGFCCVRLAGYWGAESGSICLPLGDCGDARVNTYGERCDDGNALPGDGCSGDCASVEPGYVCHEPGLACEQIATRYPHCGDGQVQPEYGEECDDGANDGRLNGCGAFCMLPYCGDGQVQPEYGEDCDDGENEGFYGGCSVDCAFGPLHAADDCMQLGPYCGDGVIQAEYEECDDGSDNGYNGHCAIDCTLGRPGYCGDGVFDEGYEGCDDGNWVSCDGCSSFCGTEVPAP